MLENYNVYKYFNKTVKRLSWSFENCNDQVYEYTDFHIVCRVERSHEVTFDKQQPLFSVTVQRYSIKVIMVY